MSGEPESDLRKRYLESLSRFVLGFPNWHPYRFSPEACELFRTSAETGDVICVTMGHHHQRQLPPGLMHDVVDCRFDGPDVSLASGTFENSAVDQNVCF